MSKPEPQEEKELLTRLRQGDEHAFSVLYERHYGRLYLHAYNRLRDREAAKDLVHDLFAGIWDKRESFYINGGVSSYLYKAVRNRVIDLAVRQKVGSRCVRSFNEYLHNSTDNTTDYLARERMLVPYIEKEIARLSPRVKMAFELSRKENLSHKEIAEKLGLSEQTVRSYVKGALKALKVKFGTLFLVLTYILIRIF